LQGGKEQGTQQEYSYNGHK